MSRQRAYGVTRCHECRRPLLEGEEIVARPIAATRWRETSRGNFRGSAYEWQAKVHAECWEQVLALGEEAKADAAEQHRQTVEALRAAIAASQT